MGKKVLIAEDSSVIQNLTRKILEQQDFDIDSAKNGKEVISKIQNDDFDLILMDINMPIIDGMECSKQIRSMDDQKKSEIPILAITGNARNYTMDEFKAVGINEYLQKPLDFDKLVTLVLKYTS
jgi:CheY-like chemotaxis protein